MRRKIVFFGGGSGISKIAHALKEKARVTLIVATTDSGGSSGKLRNTYSTIAVGDIRQACQKLSKNPKWQEVLGHRFSEGELIGHTTGNILLTSLLLTSKKEDFISDMNTLFEIEGKIIPATLTPTHLIAKDSTWDTTQGEIEIIEKLWDRPIQEFYLSHEASAPEEAKNAILEADLCVFGPGSFFGSILASLLPIGMRESLQTSKSQKVFISNLTNQNTCPHWKGEDYLDFLQNFMKCPLNTIISNSGHLPDERNPVYFTKEDTRIIHADIVWPEVGMQTGDTLKRNTLFHDASKLADILIHL